MYYIKGIIHLITSKELIDWYLFITLANSNVNTHDEKIPQMIACLAVYKRNTKVKRSWQRHSGMHHTGKVVAAPYYL